MSVNFVAQREAARNSLNSISNSIVGRGPGRNTANAVRNIIAPPIAFFNSYITLTLSFILFGMVFALIYLYFKNIGYTIDLGWNSLMAVFGNQEDVTVSLTDQKKEVGSVTLEPPKDSKESQELKAALGLIPNLGNSQRDKGELPPPGEGTLPFSREERPSGMPGATESDYSQKEKNKKKKKRSKSSSGGKRGSRSRRDGEVFNISRNLYTYEEAAPLCKAMGAELATYEQVLEAQQGGADWCNYGWSKGQMAIFPTSESTYGKLQTGPSEYKNTCGKPGVNGGFFDNPELRFGVNCFGTRPGKKDTDDLLNDTDNIVPPSAEQIEFDKKVEKFREQLENISVLPWNRKKWSE